MEANNLDPRQVVSWLRSKAALFSDMADTVERTLVPNTVQVLGADIRSRERPAPDAFSIKNLVKRRGHRVNDLARALHAQPDQIRAIIHAPDSGLKIIPRGWVKINNDEYAVKPTAQGDMNPVVT